MAQTDNYLILAKGTSIYNSKTDGIVVTSMPPLIATETKDVEVKEWPDEHGLDAYNAETLYMKAFDAEVGLACKGNADTCRNAYLNLLKFCTKGRTSMMMCSTFTKTGKDGVFYKSSSQPEIYNTLESDANGRPIFIWEWKATFNITKPESNVTATVVGSDVTALKVNDNEL